MICDSISKIYVTFRDFLLYLCGNCLLMKELNPLTEFRRINNIQQRELAEFLHVAPSLISNCENTEGRHLNFKHLIKIRDNQKGWVVTPLAEAHPAIFSVIPEAKRFSSVPIIPMDAMAGQLAEYVNEGVTEDKCERIITPVHGATCAIRINGDSMLPKYPSGSLVVLKKVNPEVCIEYGKIYVLDTENGPMIKELRHCEDESRILCVSLNPDPKFHPFELLKSSVYGWYRVMMVMSFE